MDLVSERVICMDESEYPRAVCSNPIERRDVIHPQIKFCSLGIKKTYRKEICPKRENVRDVLERLGIKGIEMFVCEHKLHDLLAK